MLKITNKDKCNGCFACYNICPKNCISMLPDKEGFLYPEIEIEKCINCNLCEKICPELVPLQPNGDEITAVAAMNKSVDIRLRSSSGGIFTALAEKVIDEGGVVFGAAFSDDFKAVVHIDVESKEQLEKLTGSKYLQSSIGDAYDRAKRYLESGRKVLFSGTPCQIGGLYAYLGHDYENLFTQDIICHGVPSPHIWEKYIEFQEAKSNSKVQKVSFRNKKSGWKSYCVQIIFENGTEYLQKLSKDLYMRGFLADIYLRHSCYNCSFKGYERISDLTLADFWGVDIIAPQMYDNKGTSLIILNSEKGRKIFDSVKSQTVTCPVNLEDAIRYNSAAVKSAPCPTKKRKAFFDELDNTPFSKLMLKHCAPTLKEKIRKNIGRILRKFKNV